MRGARAAIAVLSVLAPLAPQPAEAEAPAPCAVTVRLEPEEAFVGQQVLYALRIEQRRDVARVRFQPALSFPSMRSEWLPTVNLPDPGEGTRAYEERRALHPAHAGTLPLPEVALVCDTPEGTRLVRVPSASLPVHDVPETALPEAWRGDWKGVIGPVELGWTLTPGRIALGETARLSVRIAGPGNVWRVDPGLERVLAPADADVFPLAPETLRDSGRSLTLRHYRSYDLVPRRSVELLVPGLRVVAFEPLAREFREYTLPDLRLEVNPRPAMEPPEPAPPRRRQAAVREPSDAGGPGWAALLALLGAALVVLLGWRLRGRPADPRRQAGPMLAEGRAALRDGDLPGAAKALARCLAELRGAHPEDPFDVDGATDGRERALALLDERVERARFAGEPDAAELRAVAGELETLLGDRRR